MNRPEARIFHLGLIGWPLEHSYSPSLHTAALNFAGLAGDYSLFPVSPFMGGVRELEQLLARMQKEELDGLNVTIPHKETILPLLDELTPTARSIGAANTVLVRAGRLVGENTDAPGFLTDLKELMRNTPASQRQALVLGAGGAARAVAVALTQTGWKVQLAARRLDQAIKLVDDLELVGAVPLRLDRESLIKSEWTLLVNATPVGMAPNLETTPWPEGIPFPKGAAVYDLIYNPTETALLKAARLSGCRVCNGLGMLVEQAALSFELWTGLAASRTAMRQALKSSTGPVSGIS